LNGITTFHENLPGGSEVISGGHTERQRDTDRETGDLISLL
jgi:hypothetical protein